MKGRTLSTIGQTPNSSTTSACESPAATAGVRASSESAIRPTSTVRVSMSAAPRGPTIRSAAAVNVA